jgi:ribosomal subunit interface protein
MEVTVQGKQMSVGNALQTHVEEKLEDINQKYFNHATFATVTFSKEGHGHAQIKAAILIQAGKNITVRGEDTESDPYAAFDIAAAKVAKQLRRYKKKIRDQHQRSQHTPEEEIMKAQHYTLAAGLGNPDEEENVDDGIPEGDDPVVVAEITTDIQTLSVMDAVMRLDLSADNAIMFRNASTNELNMVYRRQDGNIGWVDPSAVEGAVTAKVA